MKTSKLSPLIHYWRQIVLASILLGSLAAILSIKKFGQDEKYHDFADRRTRLGIPNCFDVLSNLPFFFVGVLGLRVCMKGRSGQAKGAWLAFFAGVTLVSAGSAYYHWQPQSSRLVWDRLPMTIGFMGLFSALLGEYVSKHLGKRMLFPALVAGLFSVLYWYMYDDLRFYAWIQFAPLLCIPVLLILFRSAFTHQYYIVIAIGCYGMAKIFELLDRQVFELTHEIVSGHTLKHLFAALGCYTVARMLSIRK